MTAGFFRRILGSRPATLPHLTGPLAQLSKLAEAHPGLKQACEVLAAVLPALFTDPAVESAPSLPGERAADKLSAGIPLLRGEAVAFDAASLQRRWQAVCAAVVKHQEDAAQKLQQAVPAMDPAALLGEVLAGRPEAVAAKAEAVNVDPALTATVLRLTAYPALARIAGQLADLRAVKWDQGFCPTCGSFPLLGEFRGLDQTRILRCGLCASGWEFPRLRCPFCGNRDPKALGYFHFEGEENRYRAATCEECRGFVKMIFTLGPLSEVELLVTDLATLPLDLAAGDRGFLVR